MPIQGATDTATTTKSARSLRADSQPPKTSKRGVRRSATGGIGSGVKPPKNIMAMLNEIGTTGTKNFSGILLDEYLPQLSFYNSATVYNQMRRSDATVAALIAAYIMPLRSAKWYMQPYDDSPASLDVADFVHDNLWGFGTQTFDDFLREALTFLPFGFSWFEKIFQVIDSGPYAGKVGWDRFAFRYQNTRYRYNTEIVQGAAGGISRKLVSITQFAPPDYRMVDIPVDKALIFSRDKEGDNYDGIALLRAPYKHWIIKDNLYRIQAIGLERSAVGVPFARWLQHVDTATLQVITNMLENLRVDDQASIQFDGNEVEIGYLENKFENVGLREAIEHHDGQIMKAGLAQFVNLGTRSTGATGSYALSQDQSQMFLDCLNGEANYFASAFHLQATQQLLGYNFKDLTRQEMPRLSHGDIGERSSVKLGQALNGFAQYGFVTADPHTENMIRELLDLPPRDEDWRQLQAEAALTQGTYPGGDGKTEDRTTNNPAGVPQNPAAAIQGGSQPGSGVSAAGSGKGIKGNAGKTMGSAKGGRAVNNSRFGTKSRGGLAASEGVELAERDPRGREKAYETFMAELYSMRSNMNNQPLRPSEAAQRQRRAYEVRGEVA